MVIGGFNPFFCTARQNLNFDIGKEHVSGQLCCLPAQQRHKHDAPGDYHIDGNGPLDTICLFMSDILDAATGFQDAMPVPYAPAQAVPTDALQGCCNITDVDCCQQKPLQSFGPGRGILLHEMNDRYFNRLLSPLA